MSQQKKNFGTGL